MTISFYLDVPKWAKQFQQNQPKAQYWIDSEIMKDCIPYMPRVTGTFINTTVAKSAAMAGTGTVCIGSAPMGQMLYYGKVMVDSQTGKGARPIRLKSGELIFRYRLGSQLVPSQRDLTWSDPNTHARWFEYAANLNKANWLKGYLQVLMNGY